MYVDVAIEATACARSADTIQYGTLSVTLSVDVIMFITYRRKPCVNLVAKTTTATIGMQQQQ